VYLTKISVVIPIFNHAEYVIECLASVVDQCDDNFEIVAIDDGSIDASYENAMMYLSCNLISTKWSISKRENRGINRTLNEAIQSSTGEIIYLLASDDRMSAGSLKQIRQAYINEEDRCRLFFYDVALIRWDGTLMNPSASSARPGGAALLGLSRIHLVAQMVFSWGSPFAHQFYSREYYNTHGPYLEELKYEDLYFALNSIAIDRFIFIPVVLKEYRLRKNQTQTPGLTFSDLDQTNIEVRRKFIKSKNLIYSTILLVGYLRFIVKSACAKYFLRKIASIIQRSILIVTLIRIRFF